MSKFNEFIESLNKLRDFSPIKYMSSKTKEIERFFKEENLDSIVLGLSGGIDSALVLNMFANIANVKKDLIKKIVVLVMPVKCNGATGQDEAERDAVMIFNQAVKNYPKANMVLKVADLTSSFVNMQQASYMNNNDHWANGQLVSVLRTPILYYNAAILQSEGYKSIVVGTTNRDEGSYIGFYGKASDGMVDLQPIADLHKDEVIKMAKFFVIDSLIINRKPVGDVFDGRCDEDMIGAPYWFLKAYLLSMEYLMIVEFLTAIISEENAEEMIQWINNINTLHIKNLHKYKVGLPSRFVNVLNSKIPNGWTV